MIPRAVIKIAVAAGWNPFEGSPPIRIEFEHEHYVTIFAGEGVMVSVGEIAIDPTFWAALDRWLREHKQTSPGAVKLAQSYIEAVVARRDLYEFWERTLDVPIELKEGSETMEWPPARRSGR
jgi:hypothetical protein